MPVTKILALIVVALSAAFLVVACSGSDNPTSPTPANVAGAWSTYTEQLTDAGGAGTCYDTATVTITQTGATFTGTLTQVGTCVVPGRTNDNSGTFSMTAGWIRGDSIRIHRAGLS